MVRDGIGLARALKRTMMISSSASTNSVISVMMTSRKSWNEMMLSITGVADCWKPSCQGEGCPSPAKATPAPASRAPIVTAMAVNRLSTSMSSSLLR